MRAQAGPPTRLCVEQLGPSGGNQRRRRVAHELPEVREQLELASVRPVHVLEQEHGRLLERHALDETPCREEEQPAVADLVVRREPEQQQQETHRVGALILR